MFFKEKENYIKVCPNCGSKDISFRAGGYELSDDFCKNCNYSRKSFPEIKKSDYINFKVHLKKEEFRKEEINDPVAKLALTIFVLMIFGLILFGILRYFVEKYLPNYLILLIAYLVTALFVFFYLRTKK